METATLMNLLVYLELSNQAVQKGQKYSGLKHYQFMLLEEHIKCYRQHYNFLDENSVI
jgi:hypothetical protein